MKAKMGLVVGRFFFSPPNSGMLYFSYWNRVFYLLFMAYFIKGSWYSQKILGPLKTFHS